MSIDLLVGEQKLGVYRHSSWLRQLQYTTHSWVEIGSTQICIPSTLHQFLIFWNGEEVEVISADSKPFVARVHSAEALLYDDHIGPVKLIGTNKHGGPETFTFLKDQALDAQGCI